MPKATMFAVIMTCAVVLGAEPNAAKQAGFSDDSAVVAKLQALGDRSAVQLDKVKVEPAGVEKYHGALKNGPGRRDYGNKLMYAPDRGTALYCGANHASPHRLNDVWEFHLGSNTWRMICPPGNDATRLRGMMNEERKLNEAIAKGEDVENKKAEVAKLREKIKTWYENVDVKNGYLEDTVNGGPVEPWHTWDGVTYDEKTRRLYWAVLDSDNFKDEKNRVHRGLTRRFANYTGRNEEETLARLKPGSSMYIFDTATGRWAKQLGEGPFPIMRGMGGSLIYLPDREITIWYACVGNTPGGYDEGMWAYDAKGNSWKNVMPGGTVSGMMRQKKAPAEEIQTAYSVKHGKLVTVNKEMTFVYDVAASTWTRTSDNPGHGYDSHSVFAYDSNADVCLLLSKKGGAWSKEPWQMAAYDIATDKWEVVEVKGDAIPQGTTAAPSTFAGYYDAGRNALVVYNGRSSSTYVYRHKAK